MLKLGLKTLGWWSSSTLLEDSLRSFLVKLGKRKTFLFPDISKKDQSDPASRVVKLALKPKNNQGCALRKIEGSPAYDLYKKIKIF